jgi:hypothetical protein
VSAVAQTFKFSEAEKAEAAQRDAAAAERVARINAQLSTPCRDSLKNQRILMLIGLEKFGVVDARQGGYSAHVQAVTARLTTVGLRALTAEEIRRQIAQAEIDAFFRGQTDAALGAAKRMQAKYTLRGLVQTTTSVNPVVNVPQVVVNLKFNLMGDNGAFSADYQKTDTSFSGVDTNATALEMINRYADEAVAQLYAEYCQRAGLSGK